MNANPSWHNKGVYFIARNNYSSTQILLFHSFIAKKRKNKQRVLLSTLLPSSYRDIVISFTIIRSSSSCHKEPDGSTSQIHTAVSSQLGCQTLVVYFTRHVPNRLRTNQARNIARNTVFRKHLTVQVEPHSHAKSIIHKGAPLHAWIKYAPPGCDMSWSVSDSLAETLAQPLVAIRNEAGLICSQTPVWVLLARIAYLWKWNPGQWVAAQRDRVSPTGTRFTVTPLRITRCPSLGHMRLESLNTPGYSLPQLAGVFICLLKWYSANQAKWGMVALLDFQTSI